MARNLDGRAIMYADQVTGSMTRALDEMERRRAVQLAFNTEHGITPQGIVKQVTDILEGAVIPGAGGARREARAAERRGEYRGLSEEAALKKVKQLEERMYRHARDLEFEEAARLRDEIAALKQGVLAMPVGMDA